jgi:hypothetical protein
MTIATTQLSRLLLDGIPPTGILASLSSLSLTADISFGLSLSRARMDMLRVIGEGIVESIDGDAAALMTAAYEIRLFGASTDAHWQRTGAEKGRLLVTTTAACEGAEAYEVASETLPRTYRLWGKAEAADRPGWCRMTSARIRPLPVPLAASAGAALELTAEEHVAFGRDGNAFVLAQRLTGLRVAAGQQKSGRGSDDHD